MACLFAVEFRKAEVDDAAVLTGIGWTLLAVLAAAFANNIGATERAQKCRARAARLGDGHGARDRTPHRAGLSPERR
jgi:hypothetical protein